jgi:uncharacterized damage-inducible protein DinB
LGFRVSLAVEPRKARKAQKGLLFAPVRVFSGSTYDDPDIITQMDVATLLKNEAAESYRELQKSFEGISQEQSWAAAVPREGEYLHTEGSILSVVLHIAGVKMMYGSIAFRGTEIRWRDILERVDEVGSDWAKALAFLDESHRYWVDSWAGEQDFDRMVPTNYGVEWPAWKMIWLMQQHDSYHAGQISMIQVLVEPTSVAPPSERELWVPHLKDSPYWGVALSLGQACRYGL